MKRSHVGAVMTALLVLVTGACGDDPVALEGPFDLAFSGDASFQGAHAGQTLRLAVISLETGMVVANEETTVASSGASSFSFAFQDLLERNVTYQIHYWIDSNFSGGLADVCEGTETDHQWAFQLGPVTTDVVFEDTHRPSQTQNVCVTFAADLTFQGDATFQGAHGGQTVSAAVVRSADNAVLWTAQTTISSTNDPSFSFSFPGSLIYEDSFEVHYWIDSNFLGGNAGECGSPADDHQWAVDIGQPDAAEVVFEDTHRPTETEDVCSTFQ